MKRILSAGLVALLLSGVAMAAAKATLGTCSVIAPCDWTTAWTGGVKCTTADTCTITGGDYVTVSTNNEGSGTMVIGTLGVAGHLTILSNAATGANGYTHFNLKTSVANGSVMNLVSGSEVVARKNASFDFDTTSGFNGTVNIANGAKWDVNGEVTPFTIKAITGPAASAGLCGDADALQLYIVTPTSGANHARLGGRVVFQTGQARNRQYEIVAVTATTFSYCADLADSAAWAAATCGAGAITCGQRLTGHSVVGNFPVTTPLALSRHTVPVESGALICSGAGVPYPWCTGVGAAANSAFVQVIPAVGDSGALVEDVRLAQTAGTAGFAIIAAAQTNMPAMTAVNVIGGGVGSTAGLFTSALNANSVPAIWSYLNVHDYTGTGAIAFYGFKGAKLKWSACHDSLVSGDSGGCVQVLQSGSNPPNNVEITDNTIYRARGNGIQVNDVSASLLTTGMHVDRNLVSYGCTTGAGNECGGIEVDDCSFCTVNSNAVYDIAQASSPTQAGTCIRVGGTGGTMLGTVANFNWTVNCGQEGIDPGTATQGLPGEGVAITHNYISNVASDGGSSGKWYGNIIRNPGMEVPAGLGFLGFGIRSPVIAKSNFIFQDAATGAGATCQAGAVGCMNSGIFTLGSDANANNNPRIDYSDNVIVGPTNGTGIGIRIGGPITNSLSVQHNTIDGNGHTSYGLITETWAPVNLQVGTYRDNVAIALGQGPYVACATANTFDREDVGVWLQSTGVANPDKTSAASVPTDCTANGGSLGTTLFSTGPWYTDRAGLDYNWTPFSQYLTAGASPAGSPMGARAFNFDQTKISALWGYVLPFDSPFPANIANVSNVDSDGDGVIDLIDNCDFNWNPNQLDNDLDGKGDACDSIP
jgi:hypothetical protein